MFYTWIIIDIFIDDINCLVETKCCLNITMRLNICKNIFSNPEFIMPFEQNLTDENDLTVNCLDSVLANMFSKKRIAIHCRWHYCSQFLSSGMWIRVGLCVTKACCMRAAMKPSTVACFWILFCCCLRTPTTKCFQFRAIKNAVG